MDRYFSTMLFALGAIASALFSISFCYQLLSGHLNLFTGPTLAVIGTIIWKMTVSAYHEMRGCFKDK